LSPEINENGGVFSITFYKGARKKNYDPDSETLDFFLFPLEVSHPL
jgi:hypothetical protein